MGRQTDYGTETLGTQHPGQSMGNSTKGVLNFYQSVMIVLVSLAMLFGIRITFSARKGPLLESQHEATNVKPNFVFILADDLGWNSIGYDNFDLEYVTPMLNKLAANGIKMTNYYAQEVCTPSRAAFLTGRYPIRLGMQFEEVGTAEGWGLDLSGVLLKGTCVLVDSKNNPKFSQKLFCPRY